MIDFTQYYDNVHLAKMDACKLTALTAIAKNWELPCVQNILTFEGKNVTSFFEDDGYCELCRVVWDLWGKYDSCCSQTQHNFYKFVSDTIHGMAKFQKERQLKITQDKIVQLRKQADDLETSLQDTTHA